MPNPETRARVLSTASACFLANGYDATNLDEVARIAGVSKKTIYKHVGSKADLFVAAARHSIAQAPVTDLLADLTAGEPRAALRTLLLRVASLALSEGGLRFYALLTREASNFPDLPAALDRLTDDFIANLDRWFERQQAAGWLRADLPPSAADLLITLLVAPVRRDFVFGRCGAPDEADRLRRVDATLDVFLDGIVAKRAR